MEPRSQTFALILGVALLLAGCSRGPKVCAVCQREECKAMAFRVTMPTGKIETCCARCGLHYLQMNSAASGAEATDFATGRWIDATKATFVSGSDMRGCAMPATRRDAQGCCMYLQYDRCLPSLLAFADKAVAVEFQKQHGGEVLPWERLQSTPPSK